MEEVTKMSAENQGGVGGISFGGGTDNEYVREFERQRENAQNSGGTYDFIREEILSIKPKNVDIPLSSPYRDTSFEDLFAEPASSQRPAYPQTAAPDGPSEAGQGFRLPDSIQSFYYASEIRAGAPVSQPGAQTQAFVPVRPAQQEHGFTFRPEEGVDVGAPAAPEPAPEEPKTGKFRQFFSEDRFLSVSMLLSGIASALFSVLHFVTYFIRAYMFSNSEKLMAARSIASYTLSFSSPMLGLLKFLLFLVPVFAVLFTVALKKADGKDKAYNKKTVIAVLALILFAGLMTAVDVAATHLLF